MPELPEVETIAATLRPQVVGRLCLGVRILLPKTLAAGKNLVPHTFPARIRDVRRRAKLLILDLAAANEAPAQPAPLRHLVFHLKMTGKLFVHPEGTAPTPHTRLVFDLAAEGEKPPALLFFDDVRTFGYCRLMAPEELPVWPFWAALGPEPLTLEAAAFSRQLGNRRGSIKSLLLDQRVIAGIGNIYADEACFRSAVHPATPAALLSEEERARLLGHIQDVLRESIAECGSSIRDYRDANGDAGAFQNLFRVYGRAAQPCTVCGALLEKAVIAGRTTVFCPVCQCRPKP